MIAVAQNESRYEFTGEVPGSGIQFGYDAAESTNRRRSPRAVLQSEDNAASKNVRKKLISTTRDLRHNSSIARWMINKHLDFVVAHNFKAKTGDKAFDQVFESFVKKASVKEKFDSRMMHPRRRFMRILEACRTIDGDVYPMKIRGGQLQGLEGDRILDPPQERQKSNASGEWIHGIYEDAKGVAKWYAVHGRVKKRFEFERAVPARRIIPFGYFDRFDQRRGISPMTSAIRDLGDVYDGFDYALAREKVNQFFTLAVFREADETLIDPEDEEPRDEGREPIKLDFSKGPNILDLNHDDSASYLTAPGTHKDSQSFWEIVISIALKSLDLPFSFFRENYTNFFGSRAALLLYLKSVKNKREDVVDFLDEWLRWRLREGELNGEIVIPNGFDVETICDAWQWMPDGVPWWNPSQEVKANIDAINNGLRSRTEIRQEQYGDDWVDVVKKLAEEKALLEELGLTVSDNSSTPSFEIVNNG